MLDQEDRAQVEICLEQQDQESERKLIRKEKARLTCHASTQVNKCCMDTLPKVKSVFSK